MKKYIRTQTKIKEIETKIDNKELFDYLKQFDNYKDDLIKVADTIEGLCDAYVITSKQGHIYDTYGDYNYELKEVLPQAKEECPYEDWNLYGCIIVDGIIKQVAKFNDEKGKLELL